MLRTIIRNESLLRGTISKTGIVRCISISTIRKFNGLRISKKPLRISNKPQTTVWSMNFIRNYALPSHTPVSLPALSPTMEHGTLISWEKKEGDKLNEGDLLAEIETDKATMGFETPEEGYLAKILVPAGTKDIKVGKLVCIIVENEADIAAFKDYKDDGSGSAPASAPAPPPPVASAPAPPPPVMSAPAPPPAAAASREPSIKFKKGAAVASASSAGKSDRIFASPMAKRLAETDNLNLQGTGSGIYGSIKSNDLSKMKGPAAASATIDSKNPYVDIPVTSIRKVIATRLLESKQTVPHYYVTVECEVDKLLKFRNATNKKLEKKGLKVSVNDFIIKATAAATLKVPEANSYWMGSVIRQFKHVDVSVAVSTPTGLITPIIFEADRKGVVDISVEIKELAKRAKDNKLQPHEFSGGTFCVSNLGMFGVKHFCAVINPPQSCILACGTTSKKLKFDSTGAVKEVNVMEVTLSADHRTVDGAVAARWLQHFRDVMEDPQNFCL